MSRRALKWIVGMSVADAVVLALTIHKAVTYSPGPTGPTVMPLSEMVGWVAALILTIGIAVVLKESRRS